MVHYIPQDRLGILEAHIKAAIEEKSKRRRQSEFNNIVKVLKGLKLLDKPVHVYGISLGINSNGEHGCFLEVDPMPSVRVQLPEEA